MVQHDNTDYIRQAIDKVLEEIGDGWTVTNFVIPMGLERLEDGEYVSTVWVYTPRYQADYVTNGLLLEAEALQHADDRSD